VSWSRMALNDACPPADGREAQLRAELTRAYGWLHDAYEHIRLLHRGRATASIVTAWQFARRLERELNETTDALCDATCYVRELRERAERLRHAAAPFLAYLAEMERDWGAEGVGDGVRMCGGH
jgi:hypothetical protein